MVTVKVWAVSYLVGILGSVLGVSLEPPLSGLTPAPRADRCLPNVHMRELGPREALLSEVTRGRCSPSQWEGSACAASYCSGVSSASPPPDLRLRGTSECDLV